MTRRTRGALETTAAGISWGVSGSIAQCLMQERGMPAGWLGTMRLLGTGVILFVYVLVRYGRKSVFSIWKKPADVRDLLVYGILGVSGCQLLTFVAIAASTAAVATILQDFAPVMILAVECLRTHRSPKLTEILAIAAALCGVFLITTHGSITDLAIPAIALAAGILSAVCVTIYNVVPGRILQKYPLMILQAWAFGLGGLTAAAVLRPWKLSYTPEPLDVLGVLCVILIGNVCAYSLYLVGVSRIGPSKGVLYGFAEPVTAAVLGVLLFHNPFTVYDAVGFACIFLMLALISKKT